MNLGSHEYKVYQCTGGLVDIINRLNGVNIMAK